jgi:hypothetical protein
MGLYANFKGKLSVSRRNVLLTISVSLLLILLLLVFSATFYVRMKNSADSSLEESVLVSVLEGNDIVHVKNEVELRNAIYDAIGTSVIIIPIEDIYLTNSALIIPDDANITLAVDSKYGVCKLFGATNHSAIVVEDGGVLMLEGLFVTHESSSNDGNGIVVNSGGTIIMYSGIISGNIVKNGGGVYNSGTFKLYGGKISGNKAISNGGGLYNTGIFEMYGGEITNNMANQGGGVYNRGIFNRLGGVISDNKAASRGYNWA